MMKRPLWWVSESSHVESHVTRGWHPNRDCDDGDLQSFLVLRQKVQGILVRRYLPECVWWIPPGEKSPAPSQPGRVHHTQRAFLHFSQKDDSIIGEDWPNSCEADSPSELSIVTHWTYPARCFWQNCFQAQQDGGDHDHENWWKLQWCATQKQKKKKHCNDVR